MAVPELDAKEIGPAAFPIISEWTHTRDGKGNQHLQQFQFKEFFLGWRPGASMKPGSRP